LNVHHDAGRIHAFGGSNWRHERIEEANEYAARHNLTPFTASSPNFGLAEQVENPWGPGCVSLSGPAQAEARAWYLANRMPVLAYSSLARGFFSGRITPDNFEGTRSSLDRACLTAYCHDVNFERLRRAIQLAEEKGSSGGSQPTVPQIALAYILHSPLDVFPLVGAANGDEFEENVRAFDIELSEEECAWLNLET
jgi:aryl-alcohol dehydrogenase-like predicted oxidoreductase